MKKSNLNKLLNYAGKNGLDKLYTEFKAGLKSHMRDCSKKYSEDEKVIYYCKEIHKDGIDGPVGITEESFPYSFDDHVKSKINPALNYYLSWINKIFETESAEKFKAIVNSHREKMKKCLSKSDQKDKLPEIAIKRCLKEIETLEFNYFNKTSPDIDQKISEDSKSQNVQNIERSSPNLHSEMIYERYYHIRYENILKYGTPLKHKYAFKQIMNWLKSDYGLKIEEIEKYVPVDESKFIRNSNYEERHKLRDTISAEYLKKSKEGNL